MFVSRPPIHFFLHPYVEQQALYDFLVEQRLFAMNTVGYRQLTDHHTVRICEHDWFRNLTAEQKSQVVAPSFWRCPSTGASMTFKSDGAWYGGYQHTGSGTASYNLARPVSENKANMVATSPLDMTTMQLEAKYSESDKEGAAPNKIEGECALGSSHPGVFQVMVGNGSVRSLPVSVSVQLLGRLTRTQDGYSATLP